MTQTPVNIFDLLIGDLAGHRGPVTGQPMPAGEPIDLFSNIINSYLTAEAQVGLPGSAETGKVIETSELLSSTIPENVAEFNRQLLAVLPRQVGVISANVKEALSSEQIELKPGKYEILSSRIEDGRVNLEIVGKQNPGRPIKLTLPAETLTGLNDRQTNRIPLTDDFYGPRYLDKLLSKLNLKEIEIKPAGVHESLEIAREPLKITLVAEGSAGELLIKARLLRSQVRASASNTTLPQVKSEQIGRAIPVEQSEPEYVHNEVLAGNAGGRTRIGSHILTGDTDPFERFVRLSGEKQSGDARQVPESLPNCDIPTTHDDGPSEEVTARAVRFTLPDNLNTALKANGRSVMIRIEPEHLGPARLNLSMTNDGLKARIVVESAPAKAALEANLERLVNQLAEADIKVDHIEITINGDSSHNQFLGRQPHWRHRVVSRLTGTDGASSDTADILIIPPPAKAVGYAGPAGVNLLA